MPSTAALTSRLCVSAQLHRNTLCPAQIYYRPATIQCEICMYDSLCRCSQSTEAPNTIYKFSLLSTVPVYALRYCFRYYSGFGRPLCPAHIYYRPATIQCEIYLYDSLCRCSQFVDAPNTISQVLFAVNAPVFALRYCPLTARLRVHALNQ